MLLSLEFGIVVALFVAGCWSRRVAGVFLPVVGVSLTIFAVRFGNPVGLLASGGGWLILDTMLVIAVVIANFARKVHI
jgi:hypothetical protein